MTGLTRPIGRDRECDAISAFLGDLHGGRGGVLLVEGDAGSGKTTLANWALADAAESGVATLSGRSWERAQSVPYEPIVAAVGRMLRLESPDDRAELTDGLRSLAALFDGLGLETAVEAPDDNNRARLHDALATLLARKAAHVPVLFHIDDLHWTDTASLEVIQFVCRDLPWVQLGILATLRPADADERPEVRNMIASLRRADVTRSIAVRSLDRAETIAVIRDRLGASVPDRLEDLVWSRSAGTPLVVHEMIEDLLGRDLLVQGDHGWRLIDHDPALPPAVSGLITDRLDQLDADSRQVLEVLAVADAPTSLDLLARVTGQPSERVSQALIGLRGRRLATDMVDADRSTRWHPDHPIISEVVASELDELVRQRIHRRLFDADSDASTARRARHILGGGSPDDPAVAIGVLVAASDEAWKHGASREAIEMAEHVERMLDDGLGGALDTTELRALLDLRIGSSHIRLFDVERAVDRLHRAWDRTVETGDVTTLLEIYRQMDRAHFFRGDATTTLLATHFDALRARVTAEGSVEDLAKVDLLHLHSRARNDPGDRLESASIELMKGADPDHPVVRAVRRFTSGWTEYVHGSSRPLAEAVDELLEISRQPELEWEYRHRAALTAVDCAGGLGDVPIIERTLRRLRTIDREIGEPPNWREGLLRGWIDIHRHGSTEIIDQLARTGRVGRGEPLVGMLSGVMTRSIAGPHAGLAEFERHAADADSLDPVTVWNSRLARFFMLRGTGDEASEAARVLEASDGWATPWAFGVSQAGIFDPLWLLIAAHVPDDDAYHEFRDVMAQRCAGAGWLHAHVLAADARREDDPARRTALLVEAGTLCRANDLDLMAAEFYLDAAEGSSSGVPAEELSWARGAVEAVGATWLVERAMAIGADVPDRPDDSLLTRREWEVATEVAKGLTNREVAGELFISIRTVTSHLDHIYTKLGFSSREELTEYVHSRRTAAT